MTALAIAVAAIVPGAPASAATTGTAKVQDPTRVAFTAGDGKVNKVTVTRSGRTVTIDDVVTIKPGTGCRRVGRDVTKVRCTTSKTPLSLSVSLRDRADRVYNSSDLAMSGYGGSGNDMLSGGSIRDLLDGGTGNDWLYGKDGDDNLHGGAGVDQLFGGYGLDTLSGGTGADRFSGGPGVDAVDYWDHTSAVIADLDGRTGDDGVKGEQDTITADVENILGSPYRDRLTGNTGPNLIYSRGGSDTVHGGDGPDVVAGGTGDDHVYGDVCTIGAAAVAVNCEEVSTTV
jgi:Ca2+-binding RTX toxin-like protein